LANTYPGFRCVLPRSNRWSERGTLGYSTSFFPDQFNLPASIRRMTMTDFSTLYDPHRFCREMEKVVTEIARVLRPGGVCAVLIGDVRRKGVFVPLGSMLMSVFVGGGLAIEEIVVKDQHQTSMAEFFYRSKEVMRLAHEYLFVLRKPRLPALTRKNDNGDAADPRIGMVPGAVECLKGYGKVVFGNDGFCPIGGHSVYQVPCRSCRVATRTPSSNGNASS
jgi:hypothetical protein